MKKYLIKYGWCIWLSISLAIIRETNWSDAEWTVLSWQFYFVFIPTAVLVRLYKGVN